MDHQKKTLLLLDVDGTLTKSRLPVTENMYKFLGELRKKVTVGLVSGSNLSKAAEQLKNPLASSNEPINDLINKFEYVFAENGLVAYHRGHLIGKMSILSEIGEKNIQRFINFCLGYLSKLKLPCKRGTFIEYRTGMINVSPIGRSCSLEERQEFAAYDNEHKVREKMVLALKTEFGPDFGLAYSLGGQISIDCFPRGWDKTFCLRYVEGKFEKIYFMGDRTAPGGNDHELFADERTIGYSITGPEHTKQLLTKLFFK